MRKICVLLVGVLLALGSATPASAGTSEQQFRIDREREVMELLEGGSALSVQEAAEVMADKAAGMQLETEQVRGLVATMRRLESASADTRLEFVHALLVATTGRKLAVEAEEILSDSAAFDKARMDGEFAGTTPRPDVLDRIGLDAEGVRAQADLLAAVGRVPAATMLRLADWLEMPRTVWGQDVWDAYGIALTAGWILLATQSPELAPWILPNNIRLNASYLASLLTGPVFEGDLENGRIWTRLDVDDFLGAAFDLHGVTDSLSLQLPVSVYAEVNWRCTNTIFGICIGWDFNSILTTPPTVIARDAKFVFAYPVGTGEFPTRATAMDLLQSVYDRLGRLHNQAVRDPIAEPVPGADAPGASDLSTQAPRVNFFGTQVDPALEPAGAVLRTRPRDPFAIELLPGVQRPLSSTGVTAGFVASEVRAWELNILVVRWHNVGLASAGIAPSAPASIYYDVPAGNYMTPGRVDTYGPAVYLSDWNVAAALPVL